MGIFTVGTIVLVKFPHSDFTAYKTRPALVVATAEFDNLVLCQITSNAHTSQRAIQITNQHLSRGELPTTSYIRPDKLFAVAPQVLIREIAMLRGDTTAHVRDKLLEIFQL